MIVSQPTALLNDTGGTLGGATLVRFADRDADGFSHRPHNSEETKDLSRLQGQITRIEGTVTVSF
jgi:hypothetical protein